MISYITLGTNEPQRAKAFYDEFFAAVGAKRFFDGRLTFWGKALDKPLLAVGTPHDEQPATAGNGTMVALGVRDRPEVERLHAHALSLGAKDEGAPGTRGEGFFGAYFRDLDGNKLCVFTYEVAGS